MPSPKGLLLLAHGTRDSRWAQPFEAIVEQMRDAQPDLAVELAFLEFMAPDLIAAGRRLAESGCCSVEIMPLFLGMGGHVRNQVPALVAQLEAEHPAVHSALHPTIGVPDAVSEASAAEALRRLE